MAIESDAALNEANAFTITMWVKLDAGKNYHCLLSGAKSSTDNNEFLVESSSGVFVLRLKSASVTGSALSTTSWSDTWRQLVFSRASTTATVNVSLDGALAQSYTAIAGSSTIANNGLWLGADQDTVGGGWDSTQHFQGSIDEVRIYDRALSAAEVAALYVLENTDPNSDADGDGFTYAQETEAGTDPDSNASVPGFGLRPSRLLSLRRQRLR